MGLLLRLKGRLIRLKNRAIISRAKRKLQINDCTLISQNCIGGVLYHDLGLQFLSPTINAFIPEPDFVKFVLDLRHYMGQELVMQWGEEYPLGMLDDITIHFMHYEKKPGIDEKRESIGIKSLLLQQTVMASMRRSMNSGSRFRITRFCSQHTRNIPRMLCSIQNMLQRDKSEI